MNYTYMRTVYGNQDNTLSGRKFQADLLKIKGGQHTTKVVALEIHRPDLAIDAAALELYRPDLAIDAALELYRPELAIGMLFWKYNEKILP